MKDRYQGIVLDKILDRVTVALIEGLTMPGEHHKQYYLEEALLFLTGDKFVEDAKREFPWEPGVAP